MSSTCTETDRDGSIDRVEWVGVVWSGLSGMMGIDGIDGLGKR